MVRRRKEEGIKEEEKRGKAMMSEGEEKNGREGAVVREG